VEEAVCFICEASAHRHCSHITGENRTQCYNCLNQSVLPPNFEVEFREGPPPMFEGEKLDNSRMLEGKAPHQRDVENGGEFCLCTGYIALKMVSASFCGFPCHAS
jgi:hypothetical protein